MRGLEWHDEIGSTNVRAAELVADGAAEGTAVAADVQTAGRGRHGRGWEAPPGTSLMVSVVLRPTLADATWSLVPLLAGVTLVHAAAGLCPGVDLALKWPNDLLANGRKAAGILAEGTAGGLVLGMGVNVDWRGHELPEGATSLAHEAGVDVDRWALLGRLAEGFAARYRDWQADPAGFLGDYRRSCATLGRTVKVERPGGATVTGVARDVDARGCLVVDGHTFTAADITHLR